MFEKYIAQAAEAERSARSAERDAHISKTYFVAHKIIEGMIGLDRKINCMRAMSSSGNSLNGQKNYLQTQ